MDMDKAFIVLDRFVWRSVPGEWPIRKVLENQTFRYADLRCGVFDLGGSCDDTGFLSLDPGHVSPVLKSESGETIRTSISACSL